MCIIEDWQMLWVAAGQVQVLGGAGQCKWSLRGRCRCIARKEGGEEGRHRYGTRRRCVKTGDREAEGGGVSMQWASPPCCNTPRLEEALQHITMATVQESQVVDSAVQ